MEFPSPGSLPPELPPSRFVVLAPELPGLGFLALPLAGLFEPVPPGFFPPSPPPAPELLILGKFSSLPNFLPPLVFEFPGPEPVTPLSEVLLGFDFTSPVLYIALPVRWL